MKEENKNKALSLKTLTKSSVWDVQENDIFRMLDAADKDGELKENLRHIADIIRSAFMIEEIKDDDKLLQEKYTKQGYKVGTIKVGDDAVIDRNFGGGWDSLSQSIQDIIESGFDISTTTLPKDRLHKKGGMYEKKVADGYEVLEVAKGTWVEAIFAKLKPETLKPRMKFDESRLGDDEEDDEDADVEIIDDYNKPDEDDVELEEPDDDDINENNYRTTFDLGDGDEDEDAESLSDYIADE